MEREKNIKDLEYVERLLSEIQRKNESSEQLSLGMFFGLFFGIAGNAYISLLFLWQRNFIEKFSLFFFFILTLLLLIVSLIFVYDSRKFRRNRSSLEKELNRILNLRDDVEGGRLVVSNKELRNIYLKIK
ncbi:MAG: hypothetical protein ABIH92_05615 [Nanoarchaeota archaeon]